MTLFDKPELFKLCSKTFIAVYGRFPLLGELRSSVGIVRRGGDVLLMQRSDGLGWAFPGGTAWFWESPAQTLRRELHEETGMRVESERLVLAYSDRHFIPSRISVFEVSASGSPRGTWEGDVAWHPLHSLPQPFFPCQLPILHLLSTAPRASH